jgi:hypothetical protein
MNTVTYSVIFNVRGATRKFTQEVNDTKSVTSNMTAALKGASEILEKEGITSWSLVTISQVSK